MNRRAAQKWMNVCFFSLAVVAFLGSTMRYKIAFSLPFIEQKFILHSHSHFAFAGWVGQALMVLMVHYLSGKTLGETFKKYRFVLLANIITAYGMLFCLGIWGYNGISIVFSTLSLFVSYVFAYMFWKDLDKINIKSVSHLWFKASLIFNVLSSFGPYLLAYIMANKLMTTELYLSSIYYFLHFQYNGWFFFGCAGLLSTYLHAIKVDDRVERVVFWMFALACIPAYFLSALWLKIPMWLYVFVVICASAQAVGWILWVRDMFKNKAAIIAGIPSSARWIFLLAGIAFSIKLLLQLGSTVPFLSHIAFGFRPIVIGYLHLVLLGVISMFLLAFTRLTGFQVENKTSKTGIVIFIVSIILNEVVLMIQGLAALSYDSIPYTNEMLFAIALGLLGGMIVFNIGQRSRKVVA